MGKVKEYFNNNKTKFVASCVAVGAGLTLFGAGMEMVANSTSDYKNLTRDKIVYAQENCPELLNEDGYTRGDFDSSIINDDDVMNGVEMINNKQSAEAIEGCFGGINMLAGSAVALTGAGLLINDIYSKQGNTCFSREEEMEK